MRSALPHAHESDLTGVAARLSYRLRRPIAPPQQYLKKKARRSAGLTLRIEQNSTAQEGFAAFFW